MKERLQKFLSRSGLVSRRQGEKLIQAGRVMVNGQVVTTLGLRIDPETDQVRVDGQPVTHPGQRLTVMLNKPEGYVTTLSDPQGRRQVTDLLVGLNERLYPVGRLDYDAAGLLLLTNDGELAHRLMHPRFKVAKTYRLTVARAMSQAAVQQLESGVELGGRTTAPALVRLLKLLPDRTVLELTVREGRYHQVKRMCARVGHPVLKLKRIAYGPLKLGRLPVGAYRELKAGEVAQLWKVSGPP
ncbi:MAG: rRNA pseudouridine synthase [Deltaproteobacteria bacterium]|nr:rRNA pseudouridine synthase [Deltaproteobacteria bacterium]MBW2134229.1 rRNA pseudouridine synthase [Deltaproteobacteria bacterium]